MTGNSGEGVLGPVYYSVGVRWLTWLMALGIYLTGAAPPAARPMGSVMLGLTGLQLALMTSYLPLLRPRFARVPRLLVWCEGSPLLPLADMLAALAVVALTGGWGSPFYEFALTSVLAPSLRYGLRGATLASFGFVVLYFGVVFQVGRGVASFFTPQGRLDPGVVSEPLNPIMIAYFSAFLAEVLNRLKREKELVRTLAARGERNRLAREIHDGVAQTLFMLVLSLESCLTLAERSGSQSVHERLKSLVPVARQALLEIRSAMFDLGPLLEGEQPLRGALEGLFREFRTVSRMQVELDFTGEEPELAVPVRVGVYRVIQEGLANACKHSEAGRILARVDFAPGAIRVEIEDDGRGFDPASVQQGHGLANMRTRTGELGGELQLESEPEVGTRLVLTLPGEVHSS